ncbi:CAAX prenyl protease 2-like isoform X2 [Patiria miniata]|uniref:CAAX prenyl protease 2 n=1 Tax=Patiria miniata TaxID=46514 RepID=A0A914BBQ0_PATMI|nr:CAAX prenyl protease 2-like isoform X2 [Patiria miniata]
MFENLAGDQLVFRCDSLPKAVLTCFILATSYVGSLYVWRTNLPRDDPNTIKRRSLSAAAVTLLAPICVLTQAYRAEAGKGYSIWQYLGIRQAGLLPSFCLPLLLTMFLFLGPLYMLLLGDSRQSLPIKEMPRKWWANSGGLAVAIRNYIVGPITEEVVFRACMLPLLVPCLGNLQAIFVCPLFFGVVFQFFYTTVFGALSAFIFLRTGHLIACIITHMFCNFMGFPAFEEIPNHTLLQRVVICAVFLTGLSLFVCLLLPLTNPEWFANETYRWSQVW